MASHAERGDPRGSKGAPGLVLHGAGRYDLTVWLMTLGHEVAFRERILELVNLQRGERVLDVGCGSGSLAIAAKRQVGSAGAVCGIDASVEMITRATAKAGKAGLTVGFIEAPAQALPFTDGSFDVALSTIMLHHLPRKGREQTITEMRRVLRPGGRALIVEFTASKGLLGRFHRHGHVDLDDIVVMVKSAGMTVVRSGEAARRSDLHFVLATAP
jgi:ubiquinone/menaquinone biosynthesis C-methylase UbiE